MMGVISRLFLFKFIILFLSLCGCSREREALAISGSSELLQFPYPMNYPSSSPKKNKIIDIISNEEVEVIYEGIEKDFRFYKVRAKSGAEGFIIDSPNTRKVRR
jgi:hypothetical protein